MSDVKVEATVKVSVGKKELVLTEKEGKELLRKLKMTFEENAPSSYWWWWHWPNYSTLTVQDNTIQWVPNTGNLGINT